MRHIAYLTVILAAASVAGAQQWEVGGMAGGGFVPGVKVTNALGSATAGFQTGAAFGAFVGQNMYPHLSGEIRYGFMQSNMKLESGGNKVNFSGRSHVVHYDVVFHTNSKGTRAQLFAAVGGGLKIFQGTGRETAYQPLSQYAYLTRTQSVKPMISAGGGIKVSIGQRVFLRTEVRDYITMFPKELIYPSPGSKVGRLLHDFVPMAGISFEY
jgi:hypothetical protein